MARFVDSRGGLLAAAYIVAALCGYILGTQQGERRAVAASTAAARVGFALANGAAASTQLRDDVAHVRQNLKSNQRGLFDLVVATHGLSADGDRDLTEAEGICRSLGHLRCDKPALEQLRKGGVR